MLKFDLRVKLHEKSALSDVANSIFNMFDEIKVVKKNKKNRIDKIENINEENNECSVCLEKKGNKEIMFECDKYHPMCDSCFEDYYDKNKAKINCPLCRAELLSEFKKPKDLTICELLHLNLKNINKDSVETIGLLLDDNMKKSTVCTDNSHVKLYTKDGSLFRYNDLFVSTNGFLYTYDKDYDAYIPVVKDNKFHRWNNSTSPKETIA